MAITITVPRLGWSMEEGTFAGWLKRDGASVRSGDLLYALEGDKATVEVECFEEGILRLLPDGPQPGDTVRVGQVLAHLVSPDETSQAGEPSPEGVSRLAPPALGDRPSEPATTSGDAPRRRVDRPSASPRARRRAAELGVDWTQLAGSGKTGRIRERDVVVASARGLDPDSPVG